MHVQQQCVHSFLFPLSAYFASQTAQNDSSGPLVDSNVLTDQPRALQSLPPQEKQLSAVTLYVHQATFSPPPRKKHMPRQVQHDLTGASEILAGRDVVEDSRNMS